MKKYNQPKTEALNLMGGYVMQGLVVSPGTPEDPSNPPIPHAPRRGSLIPD